MLTGKMASIRFQCLLRLPPCLRRETLAHISNISRNVVGRTSLKQAPPQRPFSRTTFINAKGNKQTRPPSQRIATQKTQKAPPQTSKSKPPPRTSTPSETKASILSSDYISRLLGNASEVLLYRAPPHTAFTITSFIAGAIIIVGGMNFLAFAMRGRPGDAAPVPWHIKTLTMVPSIAMAVMGTTFLIAPTRLVRTITLVSRQVTAPSTTTTTTTSPATQLMLRFHMRRTLPVPGLQGKTIEVPPEAVQLDLRVKSSALSMHRIPISEAADFTTSSQHTQWKETSGFLSRWRSFNASLLNIWPATIHNIRRMFLRDSMAYMRIEGHGLWKLDLHHCAVVDDGLPLRRLTRLDGDLDRSVWGKVRAFLASV